MGHAGTAIICVLREPRSYWSYRTLITLKNAPTLLWEVRSDLGFSFFLAPVEIYNALGDLYIYICKKMTSPAARFLQAAHFPKEAELHKIR